MFDAKCTSCHNGGVAKLDLTPSVSYDNLISGTAVATGVKYVITTDPATSDLYVQMDIGGSMESFGLPADAALVLKWIELGALNN